MRRDFLKYLGFSNLKTNSLATTEEILVQQDKILFGFSFKDKETGKRVNPAIVRTSGDGNLFFVVDENNVCEKRNLIRV